MAIKLLIFDLDGTLVDSAPDIVDTTQFLMRARGQTPLPEATIVRAIGEGLKKLVYDLFPEAHGNPAELEKLEADFFQAYEAHLLKKTTVYPGVQEFLKKWPGKIAVVTNKYEKLAVRTLEGLGLLQHPMKHPWVCVFGAETFPKKKPDPLPLIEAMKLAGCTPEETVMIGDGLPDVQAAQAAGIRSIACTYGYCHPDKLRAHGAEVFLSSFSELESVLAKLEA